jgi:hypothetical protein
MRGQLHSRAATSIAAVDQTSSGDTWTPVLRTDSSTLRFPIVTRRSRLAGSRTGRKSASGSRTAIPRAASSRRRANTASGSTEPEPAEPSTGAQLSVGIRSQGGEIELHFVEVLVRHFRRYLAHERRAHGDRHVAVSVEHAAGRPIPPDCRLEPRGERRMLAAQRREVLRALLARRDDLRAGGVRQDDASSTIGAARLTA